MFDFSSYDQAYFGLTSATDIGFNRWPAVREFVPPAQYFDRVCIQCNRRLAFLKFLIAARELHGGKAG